jgi:hypothetical protein
VCDGAAWMLDLLRPASRASDVDCRRLSTHSAPRHESSVDAFADGTLR